MWCDQDYVFTDEELAMRRSALIVALCTFLAMECGNFFLSQAEAAVIVVFDNENTELSYETSVNPVNSWAAMNVSLVMNDGAVSRMCPKYVIGSEYGKGKFVITFEGLKGIITGTTTLRGHQDSGPWWYQYFDTQVVTDTEGFLSKTKGEIRGDFSIDGNVTSIYQETPSSFECEITMPVMWRSFVPGVFETTYLINVIDVRPPVVPVEVGVPEPASLTIVGLGGLALLRRRR